ncbi:hypothetical protein TNCV_2800791 [Trichonephila clavipes]|nr:hypothetical protein TNCV_2800791 [Trichonephila clavipes]
MWNVTDWQKVVFSDESRFVLGIDDNRVRVWRHPGELLENAPSTSAKKEWELFKYQALRKEKNSKTSKNPSKRLGEVSNAGCGVVETEFESRVSDEAHFWLNGYVNKQNCRIWSEANPQVYVETPLHPEKLKVWCALWAGGILLQKR